jgi:hypothetical protein
MTATTHHKKPETYEREYILGPDGVFYSREIITSPIVNQEKLIERCKFEEQLTVQTMKNRFNLRDPYLSEYLVSTGYYSATYPSVDNSIYAFMPIQCFTFPKANIIKIGGQGNESEPRATAYKLYPHQIRESQISEYPDVYKVPTVTPCYYNNSMQLFVMFKITMHNRTQVLNGFRAYDPILFGVVHSTGEPVIINLPNIFDTGKICTGDSFGKLDDYDNLHSAIYALGTELQTSPANNDLMPRPEDVEKHLVYNEDGNFADPDQPIKISENSSAFFRPMTHSVVLSFCKSKVITDKLYQNG